MESEEDRIKEVEPSANVENNTQADKNDYNEDNSKRSESEEILLASQMCSSCQKEKAVVICNLCVAEATTSANSLDKIPTLKNQLCNNADSEANVEGEQKLDGVYDKPKERATLEQLLKSMCLFLYFEN